MRGKLHQEEGEIREGIKASNASIGIINSFFFSLRYPTEVHITSSLPSTHIKMTTIVDHVLYNELPSLEDANIFREVCFFFSLFDSCFRYIYKIKHRENQKQGPAINAIINGPIRDVFLKHVMHVTHCLYLQHRHHYIRDQEAVVKVEGTAHLMDAQAMKDIYSFGNKIVPTTWMSAKDEVVPMEFGVVPNG